MVEKREKRKAGPVDIKDLVEKQKLVEKMARSVEVRAKNSLYPESNIRFY